MSAWVHDNLGRCDKLPNQEMGLKYKVKNKEYNWKMDRRGEWPVPYLKIVRNCTVPEIIPFQVFVKNNTAYFFYLFSKLHFQNAGIIWMECLILTVDWTQLNVGPFNCILHNLLGSVKHFAAIVRNYGKELYKNSHSLLMKARSSLQTIKLHSIPIHKGPE